MTVLDYIEFGLSKLLYSVRGHEASIFCKGPAFAALSEPNLVISSPDCGESGSLLDIDYTEDGKSLFPELAWGDGVNVGVKEFVVVCEDVDAPLPFPITHGFYYNIPASKCSVTMADFAKETAPNHLKGGFMYGANLRKIIYGGPRALKGHGLHRYYFQVVGLSEPLDQKKLSPIATKAELVKAVEGKVSCWGVWIGVSERKFE